MPLTKSKRDYLRLWCLSLPRDVSDQIGAHCENWLEELPEAALNIIYAKIADTLVGYYVKGMDIKCAICTEQFHFEDSPSDICETCSNGRPNMLYCGSCGKELTTADDFSDALSECCGGDLYKDGRLTVQAFPTLVGALAS